MNSAFFAIHGARGTMPVSGSEFNKFGGRTSCFSLQTAEGLLIFDAGTGLQELQISRDQPIVFFFTHFHLDHVIGLPAFTPLYKSGSKIKFRGPAANNAKLKSFLAGVFAQPYWPIPLKKTGADLTFDAMKFTPGSCSELGVDISWHPVTHPSSCFAYRLSFANTDILLAIDREYDQAETNDKFNDFCRDADVLIHDAHFDVHEYDAHRNWGHSTWQAAVQTARASNVRRLILAHHAPTRTDPELESILLQARKLFPNTDLAHERLKIPMQSLKHNSIP